jgi:hypothetical protein
MVSINSQSGSGNMHMSKELIDDFILLDEKGYRAEKKLLDEFQLGETLAHVHAYNSFRDTLQIKDEDGITRPYRVYRIETNREGVIAQLYVPTTDDNSQIYVNFTGTQGAHTAHADLEPNPGERSFLKSKKALMHQINWAIGKVAKKSGKPVSIGIAGHSLGGALAQQATNECMRYCALNLSEKDPQIAAVVADAEAEFKQAITKKYRIKAEAQGVPHVARENFDSVGKIKMYTWNAAGVGKPVEKYSNQVSGVLSTQGLELAARFGMVGGDGIQQTGAGTVLSDSPKADVANLKMNIGIQDAKSTLINGAIGAAVGFIAGCSLGPVGAIVGGTLGSLVSLRPTLQAHTAIHLQGNSTISYQYELIRNDTPEGHEKIKNRLQKKAKFLQNKVTQGAMSILHGFGNFVKKCSSTFSPEAKITKTARPKQAF